MNSSKQSKPKSTRRVVKVIGKEEYVNKSTGQVEEFNVLNVEERDANFFKFWIFNIVNSLDLIGNQKIRLAFWLIENMNSENQITMTMRQMAKKSGISLDTVSRTLKALIESDFIVRVNMGVYAINPNAVFKGGKNERGNVLLKYNTAKRDSQELTHDPKSKMPENTTIFDFMDQDTTPASNITSEQPKTDLIGK